MECNEGMFEQGRSEPAFSPGTAYTQFIDPASFRILRVLTTAKTNASHFISIHGNKPKTRVITRFLNEIVFELCKAFFKRLFHEPEMILERVNKCSIHVLGLYFRVIVAHGYSVGEYRDVGNRI